MSSETSSARVLARRLVMRDAAGRGEHRAAPADVVAACARAYLDLERWLGPAGCQALFARALAQARAAHPALEGIHLRRDSVPEFTHVAQSVDAFGAEAVALAFEELLVALLSLLGRMIGDDMTERLLASASPTEPATDAAAASEHVSEQAPEPGATRAAPGDASPP